MRLAWGLDAGAVRGRGGSDEVDRWAAEGRRLRAVGGSVVRLPYGRLHHNHRRRGSPWPESDLVRNHSSLQSRRHPL